MGRAVVGWTPLREHGVGRLLKSQYKEIVIRNHAVNVDDKLIDNFARPPQDPNPRGPTSANTLVGLCQD